TGQSYEYVHKLQPEEPAANANAQVTITPDAHWLVAGVGTTADRGQPTHGLQLGHRRLHVPPELVQDGAQSMWWRCSQSTSGRRTRLATARSRSNRSSGPGSA